MAVLKKIKTIRLNKCTLSSHELARPAYVLSKNLKYQMPREKLHADSIKISQSLEPLHVIQLTSDHFEFFAGWHWFDLAVSRSNSEAVVIIHKDIASREIRNFAWTYQLSMLAVDLHRETNLAQIKTLVQQIPLDIRKHHFKIHHSSSALKTVANLTKETRAAIRNQLRKPTKPIPQTSSILSELLRDN